MFINNINPILFSIGPFGVRYYGIVYFVGFIIGYIVLRLAIKHKRLRWTENQLDSYYLWLIIGSIVMARLFDVFIYNLPQYINNLSDAFKIWNGGLSIQGGLLGAIIVTLIFCKKYNTHFYDVADVTVIPTAFTLFLGKLANYTNSELYGTITNTQATPWCVVFQKVDMYCRHPTQIYEALAILLMFGILLIYYVYYLKNTKNNDSKEINENKKSHWRGTTFWLFMLLYGLLRFFITFLRDEPRYGGLNVGQWLSIIMIIIAGVFLWRIRLWKRKHER